MALKKMKTMAREFWILKGQLRSHNSSLRATAATKKRMGLNADHEIIHVREVLPNESPNPAMDLAQGWEKAALFYKGLAEDLAEAIEFYGVKDKMLFPISDRGEVARDALARYRAALEGK